MRRARALGRPPADPRCASIRARLLAGSLPADAPRKTFGGNSSGKPCDGCGEAIENGRVEYEVEVDGSRVLRLHPDCFRMWDEERMTTRPITGGSAPSPLTLFFDLGIARCADPLAPFATTEALLASAEVFRDGELIRERSRAVCARAAALARVAGDGGRAPRRLLALIRQPGTTARTAR